jgi:copper(I)-binding protein
MRRLSFAVMALLAMTGPVFAHAHLHASTPAADSAGPAPSELALNFTEGLETKFSNVEVTDGMGMRVDTADLHIIGSDARNVAIGLKPLSPGVYTVAWHATAVDTHKTEGRFSFTVTTAAAQGISVQHPWARATSASQTVGGAFLTLTNSGAPDSLVSASSPDADRVELHQTVEQEGVMKMLPIATLPVATGQAVELKPGSYHLMVMGLKHPLTQGTSFPLTLNFAKSPPVTVKVEVTTAGASGPGMDHGAMDHAAIQMAPMQMAPAKP